MKKYGKVNGENESINSDINDNADIKIRDNKESEYNNIYN